MRRLPIRSAVWLIQDWSHNWSYAIWFRSFAALFPRKPGRPNLGRMMIIYREVREFDHAKLTTPKHCPFTVPQKVRRGFTLLLPGFHATNACYPAVLYLINRFIDKYIVEPYRPGNSFIRFFSLFDFYTCVDLGFYRSLLAAAAKYS